MEPAELLPHLWAYCDKAPNTIYYPLRRSLLPFAHHPPLPLPLPRCPQVIRARIRAVTLSCLLSALITIYITTTHNGASLSHTLHLLGWWPLRPLDILKTLLLCSILFAGPLYESGIVDGGWRDWIRGRDLAETLGSWIGYRNYVAGPVTEELLFRSLIIPLHILAQESAPRIVFLTPLYFGIAHVHHYYEFRLTHPGTPALPALLRSLFQFGYTSVFGFFAAFVFLRTGSVIAVILAHSFCNWQGLPRLWGRVGELEVEAGVPMGPPDVGDGKGDDAARSGPPLSHGLGTVWTVVYYVSLVAGAVGFWKCLWVLTESENALMAM
ncbi:CAAX prenyl protease [Coniosporium tulheliwenetii]|uniref:CAAX prenyl protease n=1 Tax=Coniosporium tulheliwenetii TaxID=3383036 RepID=A0ACC2Z2F0_9PEZI|nr:CAAX prenyl protease [Cladosporium sp. JES 115]